MAITQTYVARALVRKRCSRNSKPDLCQTDTADPVKVTQHTLSDSWLMLHYQHISLWSVETQDYSWVSTNAKHLQRACLLLNENYWEKVMTTLLMLGLFIQFAVTCGSGDKHNGQEFGYLPQGRK